MIAEITMEDQTAENTYRSGFVAVVGKPNVGKSTLVNSLLQQKIAAVSVRPQTTRKRQLGILTLENAQLVFVDTPGMHKPDFALSKFINSEAFSAIHDADLILWIVDSSQSPDDQDRALVDNLKKINPTTRILLVLNKCDLARKGDQELRSRQYREMLEIIDHIEVSAQKRTNLDELIQKIINHLPEGPQYFPEDQVTELQEREIAADLVRSACLSLLEDEIPHAIAVRVDEYVERTESSAYILATIFVERESHKGIVIGKQGAMLKQIGTQARQEIEQMSGRSVFLELKVKAAPNWRNDRHMLSMLGYRMEEKPK